MGWDSDGEGGGRFARVIADLLDAAHLVAPDQLPELIGATAGALGARASRIWLVDHQQRTLVPLGADEADEGIEPAAVDRTVAGRAFSSCEPVEVPAQVGGVRLWMPLVDGVDRIGVLELDVESVTPQSREAFRHLASIATSEIITRGQYTDAFTVARRRQTMSLAAELQWQTIPPITFATRDVTIAGILEPAYHIGGDTFDYAFNDGVLDVGLFDAVGHGLVSSHLSTLALGAYRNRRRSGDELPAMGDGVDDVIRDHDGVDDYVTGQLARLDVETGVLCWLNAGHPLPLLIRQGRVVATLACPPRPPFGLGHLSPACAAVIAEDQLEPGDAVLMYTDGIIEARRPGGWDFGIERLTDFMDRAFAAGLSPAETLRRLSHAVLDFHSGSLQDDATTVLVSWHPQRPTS
ncbi:PP2C family protein-serine/threonine phosphatase [soil metagenome]